MNIFIGLNRQNLRSDNYRNKRGNLKFVVREICVEVVTQPCQLFNKIKNSNEKKGTWVERVNIRNSTIVIRLPATMTAVVINIAIASKEYVFRL